MRTLLFILFLLALDLYAFQAIRLVSQNWSGWLRQLTFGVYWSIPVLAIGYILVAQFGWTESWSKGVVTLLRAFIFIFYLAKFLMAAVLLVDDLRRLVLLAWEGLASSTPVDKSRSRFLSNLAVLLGAIPMATLTYGILRNRHRYQVIRETVRIPGLPDALAGLRIVQISDIHSGSFTDKEPVRKAVELINEADPDLVFFTGDLVNYRSEEALPFVDVFDKIRARHGVYSILGNHDYGDYVRWDSRSEKEHNMQQLEDIHRRMGWNLLRNRGLALDINNQKVGILGVENYSAHPRFPKYGDLAATHAQVPAADLKILLSHDPSHWKDQVVADYTDIDLTLSGHTHGMQFGIEIPGWIRWSPIKYVYREWAGLYRRERQFLYVNRGLGYLGYPGRVGILPEVSVLTLEQV